jgi:hypothetical protein
LPFEVNCRVFLTYRKTSHARKGASFRSYVEYISKLDSQVENSWKTYTEMGNVVAIYNTDVKSQVIQVQHMRASEAYNKLIEANAVVAPVLE